MVVRVLAGKRLERLVTSRTAGQCCNPKRYFQYRSGHQKRCDPERETGQVTNQRTE